MSCTKIVDLADAYATYGVKRARRAVRVFPLAFIALFVGILLFSS